MRTYIHKKASNEAYQSGDTGYSHQYNGDPSDSPCQRSIDIPMHYFLIACDHNDADKYDGGDYAVGDSRIDESFDGVKANDIHKEP